MKHLQGKPHALPGNRQELKAYRARHFSYRMESNVALITLNRPERKNPLTFDSYAELRDLGTARSKTAFLFSRVGLAGCDMGACAMLPRMIGQGRASELLMTGRAMGGEEGERWGFFNRLHEPDALPAEALKHGRRRSHRGRGPGPGHLHGDQRLPSCLPRLRRQAEAGVRRGLR